LLIAVEANPRLIPGDEQTYNSRGLAKLRPKVPGISKGFSTSLGVE
jgi:hypothetical protein